MYFTSHLFKRILLLSFTGLFIMVLAGCSLTPPQAYFKNQTNKQFTLLKPIVIEPFSTRTFIQNGKLTGQSGFNRYQQHCRIEIKSLSKQRQTIFPQTFTISHIRVGEEEIASNTAPAFKHFASLGGLHQVSSTYEPPETMDLVHFYLQSTSQPDIMRLTCAGALSNGDPMDAPASYRPSIANIKRILGAYGKITALPQ